MVLAEFPLWSLNTSPKQSLFWHADECILKSMPDVSPILIPVPEALRGSRALVRPLDTEDAGAVWEAIEESRAQLREWMPWVNRICTLDDERAAIAQMRAHWTTRESLTFGIFDCASHRYLGSSGLVRINWAIRAASKASSGSSGVSRCGGCTSVCSGFWRWRVNRWIRGSRTPEA